MTLEAALSEREHRQIEKQCQLAKKLERTSALFYNGMEDAKIGRAVKTLPVWISREDVEHFALRKAERAAEEKEEKVQAVEEKVQAAARAAEEKAQAAEMALQQLQGWVTVWMKATHFLFSFLELSIVCPCLFASVPAR